jgi:predicted Zn-ribbon and HTH transcriptional regulator
MPTREENILHILGEAEEPLLATEIAEHLNSELRPDSAYSTVEVAKYEKHIHERERCDGSTLPRSTDEGRL